MILRLKGVDFKLEFVDQNKKDTKKWEEFKQRTQGRLKLPVIIHGDLEPMEDADTIAAYLETTFSPSLELEYSKEKKKKVNDAGRDLYSKFAMFMRNSAPDNDKKLRDALDKELDKLNAFLDEESPGAFLDGDTLKLPDCNLLPKLMHVKEAGQLKGLDLKNFKDIMKYLDEASKQSAFKETFTDSVKKDIKDSWQKKMGNSLGSNSRR